MQQRVLLVACVLGAVCSATGGELDSCAADGAAGCAEQDTAVSDLVRVHEGLFNDEFLTALRREALWLHSVPKKGPKTATLWMPKADWATADGEEYALQRAVRQMYEAEGSNPDVAGAEVWVHHRSLEWRIGGPHFDKDEKNFRKQFGQTERKDEMSFPLRGTVTYLFSCGGPTVVYNQTLTTDLGELVPHSPEAAAISWPKTGKHITFKGSAYHQVRNDPAFGLDESCDKRTVLLVNWWDHEVPADDIELSAAAEADISPAVHAALPDITPPAAVPVITVDTAEAGSHHAVPMYPSTRGRRGERTFHYTVPASGPCRESTCVARWSGSASLPSVPLLDMRNRFVMQDAFTIPEGGATLLLMMNPDATRSAADFLPLEAELGVKMFVVDAAQSPGFLSMTGTALDELPAAAVMTASQKIHRLAAGTPFTVDEVRGLVQASQTDEGSGIQSPYNNVLSVGLWVQLGTALEKCHSRAQARLMLLSRGTRTRCAFLLSGAQEDAQMIRIKENVDEWEQKDLTNAWEYFHIPAGNETHLASLLHTEIAQESDPRIAVVDPEYSEVRIWSPSNQATANLTAWLIAADTDSFEPKQ